jgi:histone H3/H4
MPQPRVSDAIGGITSPALLRLAQRAGIVRFSGISYEESRGVLQVFLEEFLMRVVTHTEHDRKSTVSVNHVYASMWPKVILTTTDLHECKTKSDHVQTCITFPKASFERLVRAVIAGYKQGLRIQKEAAILIQYYAEMYLLKVFGLALKMAMHDHHRLTVEPKDLSQACYAIRMLH